MIMSIVVALATCGAVGLCALLHGFQSLAFLWQLPLFFAGLWVVLTLLALGYLILRAAMISMDEPISENPKTRRLMIRYIHFMLRLFQVHVHATGLEQVPRNTRFLLVCNHLSLIDPLILHHCLPHSQLAFISKQENERFFVVNKLMHRTSCQPINRENDREALKTILRCIEILRQDQASIAVFPEGYTSKDGALQPFRNGVFKIAQRAKAPIVVCTLRGSAPILRRAATLRPTRVQLDVLCVHQPEALPSTTKEIGELVHAEMQEKLS